MNKFVGFMNVVLLSLILIGLPQKLCEASLLFYETIRSLPLSERVLAARGLFRGVAQ